MNAQNDTTDKNCGECKAARWVTITVHNPDGTSESHDLNYFVGCGVPKDEESTDTVTPVLVMKVGRTSIKEDIAVNKALSKQVDNCLLLFGGLLGGSTIVSHDVYKGGQ